MKDYQNLHYQNYKNVEDADGEGNTHLEPEKEGK